MFNFNNKKKKELTRTECSVLSVAQWSIRELLPEDLKNKQVYFKQINIRNVELSGRKRFKTTVSGVYKTIRSEAYFSVEGFRKNQKDTHVVVTILFQKIFGGHFNEKGDKFLNYKDKSIISAFNATIVDFPMRLGIVDEDDRFPGLPYVLYDSLSLEEANAERDKRIKELIEEDLFSRFDEYECK